MERRGIVATYELHDRLLGNRAARRRYNQEPPVLDDVQRGIVNRLNDEGYAVVPISELLPDRQVWRDLEAQPGVRGPYACAGVAAG